MASGLLALAASLILISEQPASDSALALHSESEEMFVDRLEMDFDIEEVGQHWLPVELRSLKSSKSKKKTKTSSSSSSSSSKSKSKSSSSSKVYTAAAIAIFATRRSNN